MLPLTPVSRSYVMQGLQEHAAQGFLLRLHV